MSFLKNVSTTTINVVIIAISIMVPSLVVAMLKIAPPDMTHQIDLSFFPKFNALVNTGTTISLIIGFLFIKKQNKNTHRTFMLLALILSCIFLTSYVIYHTLKAEHSTFGGTGFIRVVYLFILNTHIILSAIVLPLVLKTFAFAFQANFIAHKRWAKYTFPMWLYVAISGVLVYLFMAPYY